MKCMLEQQQIQTRYMVVCYCFHKIFLPLLALKNYSSTESWTRTVKPQEFRKPHTESTQRDLDFPKRSSVTNLRIFPLQGRYRLKRWCASQLVPPQPLPGSIMSPKLLFCGSRKLTRWCCENIKISPLKMDVAPVTPPTGTTSTCIRPTEVKKKRTNNSILL